MAEDKRANPYPYPTAAEVAAVPGDRAVKASRNIAVNQFGGIPRRAFLLGGNDHSPVMKGLIAFVGKVYDLVDTIDAANGASEVPSVEEWLQIIDANAALVEMMEHHGCPDANPEPQEIA